MSEPLKQRILNDVKTAMRGRERARLAALRLITAAIKQREVDERIDLDDTGVVTVLERMLKQRRDSIEQFQSAGRNDLTAVELFEVELIQTYMPMAMTDAEIDDVISVVLTATGASSAKDIGRVMGQLKEQLLGRADLGAVSAKVRRRLAQG